MPITYRVEVQPLALHDMEEIVSYVAGELKNPSAAQKITEDLVAGMESLSRLPFRCSAHVPIRPLKFEYRKLRVGNYLVFFRISEEEEIVTIARVLYGRSNLDRQLDQ